MHRYLFLTTLRMKWRTLWISTCCGWFNKRWLKNFSLISAHNLPSPRHSYGCVASPCELICFCKSAEKFVRIWSERQRMQAVKKYSNRHIYYAIMLLCTSLSTFFCEPNSAVLLDESEIGVILCTRQPMVCNRRLQQGFWTQAQWWNNTVLIVYRNIHTNTYSKL